MPLAVGQGLRFGGPGEMLSLDTKVSVPITLPDNGEIRVKFKPSRFYNYNEIFDSTSNGNAWEMWVTLTGILSVRIHPTMTVLTVNLASIGGVGKEFDIVFSWAKDGDAQLFVDGTLYDTKPVSWFVPGPDFNLGGGSIGNTKAEGVFTYCSIKNSATGNLMLEWKLNEGQGTTAYDTSGNGNNGTITGATWVIKKSPMKPKKNMLPPFSSGKWTLHENTRMKQANFVGKEAGSTVANPHTLLRTPQGTNGSVSYLSLMTPTHQNWMVPSNSEYAQVSTLDSAVTDSRNGANGSISQHLFSFNLIEHVLRNYGEGVFGSAVTVADRVAWLRVNTTRLTCNWHGYGSGPAGNKATIAHWYGNSWAVNSSGSTHNSGTVAKISASRISDLSSFIDANGFVHFLTYADASNGTIASTINTDFVELEVVMKEGSIPQQDYELGLNGTGIWQSSYTVIPVELYKTYTISVSGTGYFALYKRGSTNGVDYVDAREITGGYATYTFTVDTTFEGKLTVSLTNHSQAGKFIGNFTFTNPQVELSAIATPFEPYMPLPDLKPAPMKPKKNMLPSFNSGKWTLHENTRMKQANFVGKVAGSTVENPHTMKRRGFPSLLAPSDGGWISENGQGNYTDMATLNGMTNAYGQTTLNGQMAQHIFSFDLIEHVIRNYGEGVFGSALTVADRVAWLKTNITKFTCNWHGWGGGPAGNKAKLGWWTGALWTTAAGPQWEHTQGVVTKVSPYSINGLTSWFAGSIQPDGFTHILAYADASDGTTASTIRTDFVELEVYMAEGSIPQPDYALTLNATGTSQYSSVVVPVVSGQTYCVSVQSNDTTFAKLYVRKTNSVSGASVVNNGAVLATFTVDETYEGYIFVYLSNAASAVGAFTFTNPQLEKGSVATPFEPYREVPDVKPAVLRTTNKNLLPLWTDPVYGLKNGATASEDGRTLNYTAVGKIVTFSESVAVPVQPGVLYRVSAVNLTGVGRVRINDSANALIAWIRESSKSATFTPEEGTVYVVIDNANDGSGSGVIEDLMLCKDSETPRYEPYRPINNPDIR